MVAKGLHGQDPDLILNQSGNDLTLEAAKVRVHYVDGHLRGIEVEAIDEL